MQVESAGFMAETFVLMPPARHHKHELPTFATLNANDLDEGRAGQVLSVVEGEK